MRDLFSIITRKSRRVASRSIQSRNWSCWGKKKKNSKKLQKLLLSLWRCRHLCASNIATNGLIWYQTYWSCFWHSTCLIGNTCKWLKLYAPNYIIMCSQHNDHLYHMTQERQIVSTHQNPQLSYRKGPPMRLNHMWMVDVTHSNGNVKLSHREQKHQALGAPSMHNI